MQTLHFLTFGSSPLPLREIRHFDPPQTIEYTHVHELHLSMLQTANENEKETRARELAYIYYPKKRKK